jgi:carbonic anhydrase
MSAFETELSANARYAESFPGSDKPGRAARGLAVVTCMDSRIDPLAMLGVEPGDAKILRNAGGRVTEDVLRTLVLAAYLLGVERVLVVQHTDCGMTKLNDEQAHEALRAASGLDTRSLELRTIANQAATLKADVQKVKSWPYLPEGTPVAGGIYDVRSGRLEMLVEL